MGTGRRFHAPTSEDMVDFGRKLGASLFDGAVVGLTGPLGAGKTTLARGIAQGMGIDEGFVVSSPTYTLLQSYPCGRRTLHHLDLYRIDGRHDLDSTGYRDAVGGPVVLLVEWPEREPSVMTKEHLLVRISYAGEGRFVDLLPSGSRYEEVVRKTLGSP